MSAQGWAGTNPSFVVPATQVGFVPTAPLWTRCGPGGSPVNFFRYRPEFPAVPSWARQIADDAPPTPLTLVASARPIASGIHLIVMPGDRGATWYTVQYKSKSDWDANIYARFGAITGVIQVHELRALFWPPHPTTGVIVEDKEAPCLIADIPLPGGDLDWSNGRLSLRVQSFNQNSVNLLVGHWLPHLRTLSMDVSVQSQHLSSSGTGEFKQIGHAGPRCEVKSYEAQLNISRATVTAALASNGFASPVFRFEVNGKPLGSWGDSPGAVPQATSIVASVTRPTSLNNAIVEPRNIAITYVKSGHTLAFTIGPDDGAYDIVLNAFVSERPGSDAGALTETETTALNTRSITLPPEAIVDQTACIVANLNAARTDWRWIIPLEDPNWHLTLQFDGLLTRRNLAVAGPALIRIVEAEATGSRAARHLFADAAAALQISPEALRESQAFHLADGPVSSASDTNGA